MPPASSISFVHEHEPRLRVTLPDRWCIGRDVKRGLLIACHLPTSMLPTVTVGFETHHVSEDSSVKEHIASFYRKHTGIEAFKDHWIETGGLIGGLKAPRLEWTDGVQEIVTWFVRLSESVIVEIDAFPGMNEDGARVSALDEALPLLSQIEWLDSPGGLAA